MASDIFEFVKEQEVEYGQSREVMENWNWCMKEHIKNGLLLKHGQFIKATNELDTKNPFKNKILPALNLRYRAEDIDMKDVVIYVDDEDQYHLSFLVKKYHDEVYLHEHDLDTFFDEAKEEKIDLGGVIVRKGPDGPVREPLDSIAFCDQTDILAGPIGFKQFFAPDELYDMAAQGWGKPENGADITLDELITFAEAAKQQDRLVGQKSKTPGKYIEVYRVHGVLPKSWLTDKPSVNEKDERYVRQLQIIGFYKNTDGLNKGVTLYKKQEYKNPFKLHLPGRKIRNRALVFGGIEELTDSQIWTNFAEIAKKDMLVSASKTLLQTDDPTYTNRNKIRDMDNLQVTVTQQGSRIEQIPNGSPNIALFTEWLNEWDQHVQTTSGATEALMGKNPSSGTPFRLEALVTQQGQGLHEYRRGKFATFIAEIYQDWILPDIAKKITEGTKFLATLSPDEMEYVGECLVRSESNKFVRERITSGKQINEAEKQAFEQAVRDEFARGGNKRFLEILKGEFKDISLSVKVNVAGKQKDLLSIVDRMTKVFMTVFANPQLLSDPKASKVFNKIIEYSGLDPIDFGFASYQPQQQMQPQAPNMPQRPTPTPAPMLPMANAPQMTA